MELTDDSSFTLDEDPAFVGVFGAAALGTTLVTAGVFGDTGVDLVIVDVGVVTIVEPDCSSK